MTTSSPGSHSASMVAAMASVAPTVTSTSVLGIELDAVPGPLVGGHGLAQLGYALARRVLVAAFPDGGHRDLAQLLGPVGVGEALTEVDRTRRRAPARTWWRRSWW